MNRRQIRPFLNKPTTFCFVLLSDWWFILGGLVLSLAVPLLFGSFFFAIISSIATLVAGVSFFAWAREGRRPRWLNDLFATKVRELTKKGHHLRAHLPFETNKKNERWLLDYDQCSDAEIAWLKPETTSRSSGAEGLLESGKTGRKRRFKKWK